jgi:hypothetical protein
MSVRRPFTMWHCLCVKLDDALYEVPAFAVSFYRGVGRGGGVGRSLGVGPGLGIGVEVGVRLAMRKAVLDKAKCATYRTEIGRWISFHLMSCIEGKSFLRDARQRCRGPFCVLRLDLVGPKKLPGGYRVDRD